MTDLQLPTDVHTITVGWGEPILPLISGHEVRWNFNLLVMLSWRN